MKENQTSDEVFIYDEVIYPSFVIPQSHPERLAATASLYGMSPAAVEKCRVLELGCGTGTNLNWLAAYLPESEFVGIDLAGAHIARAQAEAAELELQNVTFARMNVMDLTTETFGKFDYIIAHGLFSWVPDFVRDKILGLYDELMNPQGVGFISYNVYPGFHRRQIVRDMMLFYGQRFADPLEKVKQGVALVDFLTAQTTDSPVYHEILKYELEGFSKRTPENIYHDDIAENNQPFYFAEFIAEAEKHNLKFLSESDYLPTQRKNYAKEVVETFENISRDPIEYEQFLDFLECRRFRQTILCKKDVTLDTALDAQKLSGVYLSSVLRPTSPVIDLNPESAKEFISKKGEPVRISHVLSKVVLSILLEQGSHPVKFEDLIANALEILKQQGVSYESPADEIAITADLLLYLYSPNAVRFHSVKANAVEYVDEKPKINKFARRQLAQGDLPANFYGIDLQISEDFTVRLFSLLDGTRTRDELIAELTAAVNADENIPDKDEFLSAMPERLDRDLFLLLKLGYLMA